MRKRKEEFMSIEEAVLEKLQRLPPDKKQEVLDFLNSLQSKVRTHSSGRSLKGLWADLEIQISDQDIADARRDLWTNFPREDF